MLPARTGTAAHHPLTLCLFRVILFPFLHLNVDVLEVQSIKPETVQLVTSGYYYHDSWRPLDGAIMHQFNESSAIVQCLKNKIINMFGDSTVRQWFEYLIATLPGVYFNVFLFF